MNSINAILVDDEERARDVLENLLGRFCPEVKIIAKASNLLLAVEEIKKLKPDVVFLDIEMPKYAGYEIVDFFDKIDFEIIFVTAYDNYAIKAFELSAIDYLLKPIEIDRLKNAVDKVKNKIAVTDKIFQFQVLKKSLENNEVENLIVVEKGLQHVIDLNEIIAFEAQESYTFIYTKDRKFTASKNLKHFENSLEESIQFFRTHKSWIINMRFFTNYSKSNLEINLANNMVAKLSKYRKPDFEVLLQTIH